MAKSNGRLSSRDTEKFTPSDPKKRLFESVPAFIESKFPLEILDVLRK